MPKKLHIRKGDTVYVNAGDYKGNKGKVLAIYPKTEKALVEGVNVVSRHTKPNTNPDFPKGGIVEKEAPIHISNLMPIDPQTGEPTRIGRKPNENNKLVRYSVKSEEEIR